MKSLLARAGFGLVLYSSGAASALACQAGGGATHVPGGGAVVGDGTVITQSRHVRGAQVEVVVGPGASARNGVASIIAGPGGGVRVGSGTTIVQSGRLEGAQAVTAATPDDAGTERSGTDGASLCRSAGGR